MSRENTSLVQWIHKRQPSEIISCSVAALLLIAAPFFDLLTGFLIAHGLIAPGSIGSPSQLFRGIVVLLMILSAMTIMRSFNVFLTLFVASVIFSELVGFFVIHQSSFYLVRGLMLASYIVLFWLVDANIRFLVARNNMKCVIQYLRYGLLLVSLNVLGAYFIGFGIGTYAGGTAVKGYFASGNALGLILGVGGFFLIYIDKLFGDGKIKVLDLLIWLSCLLVGTKGVLIFFVLGILGLGLALASERKYGKVVLAVSGGAATFFGLILATSIFEMILKRFTHSSGSLTYFMGYRDVYFMQALDELIEPTKSTTEFIYRVSFGGGGFLSFRNLDHIALKFVTLESDFSDILFRYGLISLITYLIFCASVFVIALRCSKRPLIFIPWLMFLLYSFMAGHSVFNGYSVSLMAVCSGLIGGIGSNSKFFTKRAKNWV